MTIRSETIQSYLERMRHDQEELMEEYAAIESKRHHWRDQRKLEKLREQIHALNDLIAAVQSIRSN